MTPNVASSAEQDIDAKKHELELLVRQDSDPLRKRLPVERDYLRNIGHRILGQPGRLRRQQNIAGRVGPAQVTGEGDARDGRDTASIEGVTLHDDYRPPKARLGAGGIRQIRPPDLALRDHQSDRSSARRAALVAKSLSLDVMASSAWSIASVI